MTNEFEQSALAYQKSSLEWQQRCNIAIAERDALRKELDAILTKRSQTVSVGAILTEVDTLRAERDKLRDQWSDLLIEQTRLMAMRDEAIAERDKLRTFVFVSGRWIKKYGPRSGVPTPEALADFAELTEAYNALPKVQP